VRAVQGRKASEDSKGSAQAQASIKAAFGQEGPQLNGSREFLQSNSLVANIAFLLMAVIAFVLLMRIGTTILSHFLDNSSSPYIIKGMVDAKKMLTFPQDPASKDAKVIVRSDNEDGGIEFSWSWWMKLDDLDYNRGQYRTVFFKGNNSVGENGLNSPLNGPGVYIAPETNTLVVIMNTYTVINEQVLVKDIPLDKWVHVVVRCSNRDLDVYVNGQVVKAHKLSSVPKQNYGDVVCFANGGYSGYCSNLRYFSHAVGIAEIMAMVSTGPNMEMVGTDAATSGSRADYLSARWYNPVADM
jgi:hypothetical protein